MKHVYSPDPFLRHPRRFAGELVTDLWLSRELAWRLFVHSLRAQYRRSVLGYAWALLPPLITTLVWVYLNSTSILQTGATGIPYPIYVLVGTLLWQGFVDSVHSPLRQLEGYRNVVTKIGLPWEALLLAGLGDVLFNFVIRTSLLIVGILWFRFVIPPSAILAPVGVLGLLVLGFAIGLLLLPFGLLIQDVQRGLGIATTVWFFLTPVVYTLPDAGVGLYLVKFNPVTPLLVTTRALMTTGMPLDTGSFWLVVTAAVILLMAAIAIYRVATPHLVVRMAN